MHAVTNQNNLWGKYAQYGVIAREIKLVIIAYIRFLVWRV